MQLSYDLYYYCWIQQTQKELKESVLDNMDINNRCNTPEAKQAYLKGVEVGMQRARELFVLHGAITMK